MEVIPISLHQPLAPPFSNSFLTSGSIQDGVDVLTKPATANVEAAQNLAMSPYDHSLHLRNVKAYVKPTIALNAILTLNTASQAFARQFERPACGYN
jgi:hypothetical protein